MLVTLPKNVCEECRKREATLLCDFIVGHNIDLVGKGKVGITTCDKKLCEKCARKVNTRDYCKNHFQELKIEVKNGGIK